jgi:hypothetical protein
MGGPVGCSSLFDSALLFDFTSLGAVLTLMNASTEG